MGIYIAKAYKSCLEAPTITKQKKNKKKKTNLLRPSRAVRRLRRRRIQLDRIPTRSNTISNRISYMRTPSNGFILQRLTNPASRLQQSQKNKKKERKKKT